MKKFLPNLITGIVILIVFVFVIDRCASSHAEDKKKEAEEKVMMDAIKQSGYANELQKLQILKKSGGPDEYGTMHIYVTVRNNTASLMDYAQASVVFLDAQGTVVGKAMGNTTNLPAGKYRTIEVVGLNINGAKTYNVEVQDSPF